MFNLILHPPLSDSFLSKGDANSSENELESKEVPERATVTQSGRVVKSTRTHNFEYDLHVISSALPTSLLAPLNHLIALLTEPRASPTHLLAKPTLPWCNTTTLEIGVVKPEIEVSSLGEAAGVASYSHTIRPQRTLIKSFIYAQNIQITDPTNGGPTLKLFLLLENASTVSPTRRYLLQCFKSRR